MMGISQVGSLVDHPRQIRDLTEGEIALLLSQVFPLFVKEPALMELSGDVVFVGDIHGDFTTAVAVMNRFLSAGHVVFLGDYIDRAPIPGGSLDTIGD